MVMLKLYLGLSVCSILIIVTFNLIVLRRTGMYFVDIPQFFGSLTFMYYVSYYTCLALICILILFKGAKSKRFHHILFLLLLFTFLLEMPRFIYTCPIQLESDHPAQTFYILKHGNIENLIGHVESPGNAIFWAIFTTITSFDPLSVIAFFAPLWLSLAVVLSLVVIARSFSRNLMIITSIVFLYFVAPDLSFAARYPFANIPYILSIGCLIGFPQSRRSTLGAKLLALLVIPATVISHPAHGVLLVLTIISIAILTFFARKLKNNNVVQTSNRDTSTSITLAIYSLVIFLFWQMEIALSNFRGWINAVNSVINSIVRGLFEPKLIEGSYKYVVKPTYDLILKLRMGEMLVVNTFAVVVIFIFFLCIVREKFRRNYHFALTLGVIGGYLLHAFIVLIGLFGGFWSLRPICILIIYIAIVIPFLIVHSPQRRMQRCLTSSFFIVALLFASLSIYTIWGGQVNSLQVSDGEAKLVEFVSHTIPYGQHIGRMGFFKVNIDYLPLIFAGREDLRFYWGAEVTSDNWLNITDIKVAYILVNPSIERFEAKYVFYPGLSERVRILCNMLTENFNFSVVYSSGTCKLLYKNTQA